MASNPFKIIMEMDLPRMQMYLSRGQETRNLFGMTILSNCH